MRTLWRDVHPRHAGPHYRFDNLGFEPKPVRGDVPIWVGGNSPAASIYKLDAETGEVLIDVPSPIHQMAINTTTANRR